MSTRLERERDFHNATFAARSREDAAKFYEVEQAPMDGYVELLRRYGAPGRRVLEYGCGPGSQAFTLAAQGVRVTGIDISDVAIDLATERAALEGVADNADFRVMNAEATDFGAAEFDLVCGTAILHHLDVAAAYSEIGRVLRSDGHACFVEPLGHNPAIRAYRDRTPELRTEDEHPLLVPDLELLRAYFGTVETTFFNLLTLAAVPLRRTRGFGPAVRALSAVDRLLFRLPAARRQAWMVLISVGDPLP
jgi:SAM-dependent methyltransferase